MGDQSQKTLQSDGQKTANSFGKCKYFSHFLQRTSLSDGAKKRDMGFASDVSRVARLDSKRWAGSAFILRVCRIVEERLADAISSAPKADYTKVLIGAALNTARRAET
jgi:hypothetical protein